jgi:ribosomal protein L29
MDNRFYTQIECPQCGFEGAREISVKDEEIAELKLQVEQLKAELGDLPEAQADMLREINRLKTILNEKFGKL